MSVGHFPNLLPTQPHQFPNGHAIANGFMSFCGAVGRLREKKDVCQTTVLQGLYLSGLISQNIPNHSELVLNMIFKTLGVGTCGQMSWFHPILRRLSTQEVLRVTPAYRAFEKCAQVFRPGSSSSQYHKSQQSDRLGRFWSYSYHGSRWMQVLTLLVQYHGLASILLGTSAAFVMMLLFSLGYLPIYERPSYNGEKGTSLYGEEGSSLWSLAVGLLVSIVSFTSWKSRQQVFLDRICINHEDADMKTEAIFSLAGMLKASKELLVLWDTSWSDRLWCLFELAAFLKSKSAENSRRVLIIRPTIVGPCSIAALLTTWSSMFGLSMFPLSGFGALLLVMSGFWAIVAFRGYFSAVEILEERDSG